MTEIKDYEYFAKRVETFESILEEIHSGDWNHSWTGMIIRLVDKHMPLIVYKEDESDDVNGMTQLANGEWRYDV